MITAVSADTQDPWRELNQTLDTARTNGWVLPNVRDFERYTQETLKRANEMAKGDGDACQKALRVALFLDANRLPTAEEYAVQAWDAGLVGDLFGIWFAKDETDVMKKLAFRSIEGTLDAGVFVRNLVLTSDAILNANSEMALANRAAWLEEIVALGLRKGWDADTVALAEQRIDARIWDNINAVPKIDAELEQALDAARFAFTDQIDLAEKRRDTAINAATGTAAAVAEQIANARLQFTRDTYAALVERRAAEETARATAARKLGQALQNIAKARVQRDALHRYILPVSQGRCAEVRKEGPLPAAECTGESCAVPPIDPAFVPPAGGYWAMIASIGRVYEDLNEHECYETRGTVGNGSASYSDAEVACSNRWGPISASYTWSPPPAALVPGQEYPVSASISGSYIDGHGGAALSIDMDVSDTECGARTGASMAIIRPDGDGRLDTNWNREHEDAWSGTFKAPGKSFGASVGDSAPRFQIKASPFPVGCYRYIYEWRE